MTTSPGLLLSLGILGLVTSVTTFKPGAQDDLFELEMGEGYSQANSYYAHANRARIATNKPNTPPLDLDELRKLGVNVELLVEQLKDWIKVHHCDYKKDEALLVRHFIRNKTVTCNDGSQAG